MEAGTVFEGKLSAQGLKLGVVVGRFNSFFGDKLLSGALDALHRSGADAKDVHVAWVPGVWEIPLALKRMAATKRYDALIALGVVIRGHTPHFEYVTNEASKGAAQVMLQADIPVAFGLITADNLDQAIERSGTKAGNKGYDAAVTAIEMAALVKAIG